MARETTRFRQGKQDVACRYRIAVRLLTTRSGRYSKERRAGRQEGCRTGRYGGGLGYQQDGPIKEVLAVGSSPPAQAGKARKGELAGRRAGTGGLGRSRPASGTSYPGQYDKKSRTAGPLQDDCRADRYGRDSCTMHIHHNQLITSTDN
jgi:hypothetical protein